MKTVASILAESTEPVVRWYARAQIDYTEKYIRMYIAYNTWYREVVGTMSDRRALLHLKKRDGIWTDYLNGTCLKLLKSYMQKLVDLTGHQPLASSAYWSGSIDSVEDWRGLIEFWYQVRCILVHGGELDQKIVWLAYETLDSFMSEIIRRMYADLHAYIASEQASDAIKPARTGGRHSETTQHRLRARFYARTKLWHVDVSQSME